MADPKEFVHLHTHSEYSLLDGAIRMERLVEAAHEHRMSALAVTDHGNLFGAVQLHTHARKRGMRPIIGCEIYVAKESRHKKSGGGDQSNHLVLLAETTEGYRNLCRLVSLGYLEGFYYRPRVDKELLSQHSKGMIALSACLKGAVPQLLLTGQEEAAAAEAASLRDLFGPNNFYLELQNHGLPGQQAANAGLLGLAARLGIPAVCTNDAHYLKREDSGAHDVLLCIGTAKTVKDADRMRYASDQFYLKSAEEMHALWSEVPEAIANTLRIAERCEVEIVATDTFPAFEVPPGYTAESYFETVARQGLAGRLPQLEDLSRRGLLKNPIPAYEARLSAEIEMISRMNFAGYFLIVWDLIRYARENRIPVGPGRGSVVGSLVAYCLKITDIDPLQYDLFFERFMNPERIAPPDIDMDFCMHRRSELIDYAARKYGRDCVCQIITFGTMAARGVIRDVGRSLEIPYADIDRIAKLIPNELHASIDKAVAQEPRLQEETKNPQVAHLIETARRLEGLARHASTHAAGVVIAPKPLIELLPLYKSNKDEITTQFSMKDLEAVGLIKMDFLALATLTVLDHAVKRVKEETGEEVDLAALPLNDPDVYALFSEARTNGIFQFESGGMKAELRRLKPERFEDLIALNALYRPGPMEMIPDFIRRKHGQVEVRYPHPILEEILRETYGVIVYQEQVMQIASKLAGFSLGQADVLRKAMGKKQAAIMTENRDQFIDGAVKNGIPAKTAVQVYDLVKQFAQYGFNKSHSTAYALLAYQTAYMKVHYPVQFMAALLSSEIGKMDKVVMYIAECKEMGIQVLPPDVNESELSFHSLGGKIRFGLLAIRHVGEGAIQSILEVRRRIGRYRSLHQFCEEVDSRAVNRRVLESLIKCGAHDSLGWRRSQLMALADSALEHGQRIQRDRASGQKGLFSDLPAARKAVPDPIPPDVPDWPPEQVLACEKEMLGFFVSGHPLERYSEGLRRFARKTLAELIGDGQSVECNVAGIVTECRSRRTKKGDLMAVFTLDDGTGTVETVVFPRDYARFESYLKSDAPILVSGRFDLEDEGNSKIIVSEIQALEGIAERNARMLQISAAVTRLSPETATELHRLLDGNRGNTGVQVQLYHPGDFRVTIQSADFLKVRSSLELIRQIENLCGAGSVEVVQ